MGKPSSLAVWLYNVISYYLFLFSAYYSLIFVVLIDLIRSYSKSVIFTLFYWLSGLLVADYPESENPLTMYAPVLVRCYDCRRCLILREISESYLEFCLPFIWFLLIILLMMSLIFLKCFTFLYKSFFSSNSILPF